MKLFLATGNKHKIEEIKAIFQGKELEIYSILDGISIPEVVEDGKTFEENSQKKALEIAKHLNMMTIADDSGLCVDALGGAPGVYSARFGTFPGLWPEEQGGGDGDDGENNRKLIELIKDVPYEKRTARFVSVITMVYPDGRTIVARGEVEGHVIPEVIGDCGFGYDPLFIPEGYEDTFGVLSAEVKNSISHRSKALMVLKEKLENSIG